MRELNPEHVIELFEAIVRTGNIPGNLNKAELTEMLYLIVGAGDLCAGEACELSEGQIALFEKLTCVKIGKSCIDIDMDGKRNEIRFYHAGRNITCYAYYNSVDNTIRWDHVITGDYAKKALEFAKFMHSIGILEDIYND